MVIIWDSVWANGTKNYGSAATERKIYVGKGIKYFSNIGVAEFLVETAEVSVGDKTVDYRTYYRSCVCYA